MVPVPIYMDNHSTTRVDPRVLECMLPYFSEKFGNAASITHSFGREAADAVAAAREQVARLIGAPSSALIFTSGATESNNIALKGVVHAAGKATGFRDNSLRSSDRPHLITTAAEHRSVLDPVKRLKRSGYRVTLLPVDRYGLVDPQQVADAIQPATVLVSVMMANNEVGSINDVSEIGRICRERGVLLHTDAAQAVGRIPIDLATLPVDLVSLTAHKLYGPKGVGGLVVRRGDPTGRADAGAPAKPPVRRILIDPLFDGGGHERRLRSGTLPVPLIVGFGRACELAGGVLAEESARIAGLRDRLYARLCERIDGLVLNGHPDRRLPGNLSVSVEGVDGDALMTSLRDVAVSSGSACTSADPEPSHVLRAMGLSDILTRTSLRFGLGRFNTREEVDYAVDYVAACVARLRRSSATSRRSTLPES